MYHPFDLYVKTHQESLLSEARTERSLSALRSPAVLQDERPGFRDRVLLLSGDWLIALGHRLHNATRCCTSQSLSEGKA